MTGLFSDSLVRIPMLLSQNHISSNTPMGANLFAGGATFRVWAPDAEAVYVNGVFGGTNFFRTDTDQALRLQKNSDGRWTGFLDGVQEGDRYKFYVVGKSATRPGTNGAATAFVRQLSAI
jgi:1,4-alpha-glucan branching enzyme